MSKQARARHRAPAAAWRPPPRGADTARGRGWRWSLCGTRARTGTSRRAPRSCRPARRARSSRPRAACGPQRWRPCACPAQRVRCRVPAVGADAQCALAQVYVCTSDGAIANWYRRARRSSRRPHAQLRGMAAPPPACSGSRVRAWTGRGRTVPWSSRLPSLSRRAIAPDHRPAPPVRHRAALSLARMQELKRLKKEISGWCALPPRPRKANPATRAGGAALTRLFRQPARPRAPLDGGRHDRGPHRQGKGRPAAQERPSTRAHVPGPARMLIDGLPRPA